jgi:predicted nicotinamide N-methyase
VLDLAAGSGLVAIAALRAAACEALAADIDTFAAVATVLNATANGVSVATTTDDLLDGDLPLADVILVGDLFYERPLADRAIAWLARCADAGKPVLVGDPGRSYFPRDRFERLAEYAVPVTRELEDNEIKRTAVWRLR